jgi:uncharacterized membrane-anchored protein YhcB (DUF1043 family)
VFTKALKSVNVITQILNADFSKIKKIFETKENESLMCENTLKYALKEFKEEFQLKENESLKKELEKSSFKSATQMLEFLKANNSSIYQKVAEHFNDNYNVLSNEKETEEKLFKVLVKLRDSLSKEFKSVLKDKALKELNSSDAASNLAAQYLKY